MAGRLHLRLLAVPLLLVLVPCAVIGIIGYQWLRLERAQEMRRGREAAADEAARLRADLLANLTTVAEQTARAWRARAASALPFAPPPASSPLVADAYRFSQTGALLFPNYERAYRDLIRQYETVTATPTCQRDLERLAVAETRGEREETARALAQLWPAANTPGLVATLRLAEGRLALAQGNLDAARRSAETIFDCCAAARDEFGTPFAVYAAWQLISAWRREGTLARHFPQLGARVASLLDRGSIGHPADLPPVLSIVDAGGRAPEAAALAETAKRAAARIERQIADGVQFERWVAASTMLARESERFLVSALWSAGRPRLVGMLREPDGGFLAVVFDTGQVENWLAAHAAEGARFDASLVVSGEGQGSATFSAGLYPQAPGLDLVLQPRAADPAMQRYRSLLFAGSLVASLLLALVVGYLASRDIAREARVAALRANFVAGVTHELKTPLTSIRLLAETLRLKRTRDPATADELLAGIVDETERLGHLLDNVLGFASIDRGENVYRPEEIELGAAVGAALARLRRMLDHAGFRVTVDVKEQNLHVRADADALDRAVANLVSNAMKYSGASKEIGIAIDRAGSGAELSVTDHGIGVPPEDQRRIFDRFYRAHEASRVAGGAGLGLALVRHFAEAHGGRVTLASGPDRGSTFSLWLPLARGSESRDAVAVTKETGAH